LKALRALISDKSKDPTGQNSEWKDRFFEDMEV
jgi:hypothetical protein